MMARAGNGVSIAPTGMMSGKKRAEFLEIVGPMPDTLAELRALASVYIISSGSGGSVKIGVSRNPSSRLRGLQVGHERTLRVFWSARFKSRKDAFAVEKETHKRLRPTSSHSRGEWYWLDENVAKESILSVIRHLKIEAFT